MKFVNRNYFTFLAVSCALFLLLFCVISYYNHFAADDFYYLANYREAGVWGCMQKLYFSYSGRWSAYLLTGWVVSLNNFKWSHLAFNCFTLFSLVTIIYVILRKIFFRKFKPDLSIKIRLLYAVLLSAGFFFSSYSIGETWFWLVQVCTYLWSIIMSLILIFALTGHKITPLQVLLIIISALFIGGSSEAYTLVIIFVLVTYLIIYNTAFSKYFPALFYKTRSRNAKAIIALCFVLLAFVITMLAPGNKIRYAALPKATFIHLVWVQLKSFVKVVFIITPLKIPYLILFGFPWFILGRKVSENKKTEKFTAVLYAYRKHFFIALIFVFIFLLPTSIIMTELGPDRALSQVSFFISACFSMLFFIMGSSVKVSEKVTELIKTVTIFCSIGVLVYHLIVQYTITSKYSQEFNSRMDFLKSMNESGCRSVVELDRLPPSGMIYSAEISADTAHFTNHFLEQSLRLKFHVKVSSSSPQQY